ncbi:hypothetical protein SAMN04515674_12238 [Pseudarcicella hirudinis]|uniref:HEAT repeat-containing protein n=1 Tax=Pseudarcicella hirudinis TaxID=1079859 RepID=A0A1I5YWV1_9BACT|nr:hypothetical protein [Pseudarcicella hirudinis]SFQ48692.1 hypothetical protein SAMN04515674_12238 [Pseudarcicella hirudinis]
MNLREAILAQHSKEQVNKIVSFINGDPEKFAELMHLFFEGEYRVTQRAAWSMSDCVRKWPYLLNPYFKQILENLLKPDLHDAIKRNSTRILQEVAIPEDLHGLAAEICFGYLEKKSEAVAIRAFAMKILYNLSLIYPELQNDLIVLIEEQLPYESPAFTNRGKKILAGFKKRATT